MIDRLLRWLGLRPRADETLEASGRLEMTVDGEPWSPVTSLAGHGPDDRVYVLRTDGDTTTVTFGDGMTGRRPPAGARIGSTYRHGGGASGGDPNGDAESDPLRALLDLLAQEADILAAAQEQIANEAFIETASGSVVPLTDATAIRQAVAEAGSTGLEVCIRFHPWTDPHRP